MLRNLFKTAVRNLSRNKFLTILKVVGTAPGVSLNLWGNCIKQYAGLKAFQVLIISGGFFSFSPKTDLGWHSASEVRASLKRSQIA
jgi:hypothetical protein